MFEHECDDLWPLPKNLEQADEGYRLCDTCCGEGVVMVPKMYPGGHTEDTEECPDCCGEGQIEDEPSYPTKDE